LKFEYTPEALLVRDMVRDFVDNEIRPNVKAYEHEGRFPSEIIAKIGELGLAAPTIPDEYGGGGIDTVAYCLALEEIAKVDPSTAVTISVNNSVCCLPILTWGDEQQKTKYLLPCAKGEFLGGFALTEPGAGSDAAKQTTRARQIDGGDWLLDGTKAWITNAGVGKLFIVMAVTDPDAGPRGISAFLVESEFDGFKVAKEEDKMGLRASKTAQIVLEECRVPAANVLGELGQGLKIALTTLDSARIGIAAQSVGIAQGCLEEAIRYAQERQTFGKPIAQHQAIAHMIADMATEIDASRLLTHRAAWLRDRGRSFKRESAMAKLYAAEACNRVAYSAVQIHGGYGYSKDYAVERLFRDARVTTIYEGTSEIQRLVIARELLRD